jgi:preprotein translocase subunit SecE
MKLINYLKETKGELKHVSWPTKIQTVYFTIIVIILSLITAFFLGFFDTIFAKLLRIVI